MLGSENRFFKVDVEKKRYDRLKLGGTIYKIKKFNETIATCASSRRVEMVDLRINTVVQQFPQNYSEIKSLEVLPPHTMVFGG